MCPLHGHVGVSEIKDRLLLPTSIVTSPIVDKLQEHGKKQWTTEVLVQSSLVPRHISQAFIACSMKAAYCK